MFNILSQCFIVKLYTKSRLMKMMMMMMMIIIIILVGGFDVVEAVVGYLRFYCCYCY